MDASAVPTSAAHLPKYEELYRELVATIPAERLIRDPLRKLAYGTDASFYRLVPQLVVIVESEAEVARLLAACRRYGTPVTFRAAGTSLSGQAVTDSVLAMLGEGWGGIDIAADAATVRLQPGVLGSEANRHLARFGRKIGPDPASINACKIGGIAANNASGMCCGTAQNSYNTLAGMRVMLADGGVLRLLRDEDAPLGDEQAASGANWTQLVGPPDRRSCLDGGPAPPSSITPRRASVAVVVAVGMWATRERRPSAASCPQRCRRARR